MRHASESTLRPMKFPVRVLLGGSVAREVITPRGLSRHVGVRVCPRLLRNEVIRAGCVSRREATLVLV